MTPEPDLSLGREYRYNAGWKVFGCVVWLLGTIGAGGLALIPVACEKFNNGEVVLGVFLTVVCVIAAPMLLLAAAGLSAGLRETVRPTVLRVTPAALVLPDSLRGAAETNAEGEEVKPPPQPEEVPFTAVRWVRREAVAAPDGAKLMIVHDLSPATLVIDRFMMRPADFDELEAVLRAAVPHAFTSAPPTPPVQQ